MLYVIQSSTKKQARHAVGIERWEPVLNARVGEGFMGEMGPGLKGWPVIRWSWKEHSKSGEQCEQDT